MSPPLGVGIVGCGSISGIYLTNLRAAPELRLVACCDRVDARAAASAAAFGIDAVSPSDLMSRSDVDIVVNLTNPTAHAAVARAALRAGKHVYNEKPLGIEWAEAQALLGVAAASGRRLGAAPDTFMGAGIQTCRGLVDEGAIGAIVAGVAFMTCPGHEAWHPDPDFYYQPGGGPLLDMGPYYVTALVTLLGPVRRVAGTARRSFTSRTIGSLPRRGASIEVGVPTHTAAVLDFASGAVVSLMMSFDVHAARLPHIEIYGSTGTLAAPDPNMFDGPVQIFRAASGAWAAADLVGAPRHNSRGLGVIDMARAIAEGRPHRCSAEMALHVLEVLLAVERSSETGRHVTIETTGATVHGASS